MMDDDRVFVAVYEIPCCMTDGYCVGHGVPIVFRNVDWFTVAASDERERIVAFIRAKRYIRLNRRYLVLSRDPASDWTFVIEPEYAP